MRVPALGPLLLACLIALLAGPAQSATRGIKIEGKEAAQYISERYGKAYAVVIGINQYRDKPAIPELHYAVADAKAVGEELASRGFMVISLLDQEATRDRILEVLGDDLPQKLKPEDRLLIFYAGHGETKTVSAGHTMGYLLPVDAKRDRLHKTSINMGEIRQLAGLLPAKHVLYIVDVCYGGIAGQQTRSLPPHTESYLKQITQESGRQLITAGGPGQQVIEGPQWGHSVFTYYLLEGLKKGLADLNHDGVIPASELYAYLDGRVPAAAEGQQRPELWSLAPEKGEFVFFTNLQASTASVAAKDPSAAPTDEIARMRAELDALKTQIAQPTPGVPKPVEVAKAPAYHVPSRQSGLEITGHDGAPMVLIPGGKFLYGKDKQEQFLPAFYADKFEVSRRLYGGFLQTTGREVPESWNEAHSASDESRPVVGVSWHDADAYCRHYGKRLPTEQEWEKAARGTDGRKYPWGNATPSKSLANYAWEGQRSWQGYATLATVDSYEPGKSPYGVYNMIGNVLEWTSSTEKDNPDIRVMRGHSWRDLKEDLSVTLRVGYPAGDRLKTLGFRCAMDSVK